MVTSSRRVSVVRMHGQSGSPVEDVVAVEEPLEVRLHGRPFAVIMRTPGADRELVAGFLLAERVIVDPADLGTIGHCTDVDATHPENVVNVTLVGEAASRVDEIVNGRRRVVAHSSCGLCGRQTIAGLKTDIAPLSSRMRVSPSVIETLPVRLREAQVVFGTTGGLHAAGLFDPNGTLLDIAEDVGRHNAVDKVVGRRVLREALPLDETVLFVSGRTSFEIVQKAALAGVPMVASVSAPSSLAIDLAAEMGIALIGFVRGKSFNLYSFADRVSGVPPAVSSPPPAL